ncbi:MAG: DUF445 family protein [Rectinemataceae bacterium]
MMEFFRTWLAPPLIGGVIGLFTNWLAIKMLFRPLKEIRVLGIKMPFTPGILPRERERIADSVGEIVAKELLTPDALETRFQDPILKEKLSATIDQGLEHFFAEDSGKLLSGGVKAAERDTTQESPTDPLGEALRSAFRAVSSTAAFRDALAQVLRASTGRVFDMRLGDVLDPPAARAMAIRISEGAGLTETTERLDRIVDAWYDTSAQGSHAQGPRSAPLIPAAALEPLIDPVAKALYTAAIPVLEDFIADPGLKKDLEKKANEIIKRAVGRLGPVQRLIVAAANYEDAIAKTMPETIADLSGTISSLLRDPGMSDRVSAAFRSRFLASRAADSDASDSDASDSNASNTDRNTADSAADSAVSGTASGTSTADGVRWEITGERSGAKGLEALISRESLKIALAASLKGLASSSEATALAAEAKVRALADRRIGDLAAGSEDLVRALADKAAEGISKAFAGEGKGEGKGEALFAGMIELFRVELSNGLHGVAVGETLGFTEEKRKALSTELASRAVALVSGQAGRIIEAIDIGTMVVTKINALDMLEAERIILRVVDKELYWITVLGGILGAIIGVIQSLLYAL